MKLNKLQQAAVSGVLILVVGLIVQFGYLKNDKALNEKYKKDIDELNRSIRVARAIQQTANELQEEMNHLKAQLERLKKILPVEINKPRMMADIKRYANENGIEITKVSANKPLKDDVILEHPLSYFAQGQYHDFGFFFAQLTTYPRILNIKGASFVAIEDSTYPVQASFIISTYTYKEPTEEELRQQIQEKKEARKGGAGANRGRRR